MIGITGLSGDAKTEYELAIEQAGGVPLRLENDPARIAHYLATCSGFVFSGGWDVSPASGGTFSSGETYEPERDAFELALARELRERTLPTLGICRGLQVLNVAFGGTLVGDLARDRGVAATVHQPRLRTGEKDRRVIDAHVVSLEQGRLSQAIGAAAFPTTSRHHQAIDALSADLTVVGRTPDGVVEAVEAAFAHPWFAAVQWHPETSAVTQDDAPSRALFSAFLSACRA